VHSKFITLLTISWHAAGFLATGMVESMSEGQILDHWPCDTNFIQVCFD